nr:zinc finger, SWIM-type [Tanacetum cinerariifolium]
LHHGGKFTPSPKRRYVGGKLNYVDNIDMDLFNVDELHMFVKDLGYDPKQLMFYQYKLPDKSLDYGLRPLSCDASVVSLIKLVANFKCNAEIEEIDDDVLLNAPMVGSSKTLALCWINEADVGESSVDKNANMHEEQQIISVNNYLIDDRYELDIDENLNLEDYTVYVHKNVDENINVNADDENVNADDEYDSAEDDQDHGDDKEGRGNVREYFIVDEEHVVNEVEVNMEGFSFSVQEQGADQTLTPNVDLTDEALEVLDFDSFDSDVGDDTESIKRRKLRKLRKTGGGQYKELLWKCATATSEVHFERAIDEFKGDSPVITALEYVREYLMKKIVIVKKVIKKSQGPLTPTVTKIFKAIKEKVSQCVVVWNGTDLFQVNEGLPDDWVHQSMRLQTCKTVYSFKINPVPSRQFWAKSQVPSRLIPLYISPQVGIPGKKRKNYRSIVETREEGREED